MKKVLILVCLAALFIEAGKAPKNILIYTHNGKGPNGKGYVHDNIPAAVEALKKLSAENGYKAESTDDPAFFTEANLKKFDCKSFPVLIMRRLIQKIKKKHLSIISIAAGDS